MKNLMIITCLAMIGCTDKGDSGDTTDTDTTTADLSASVAWGGSAVALTLTDGSGSYFFGMAETGSTCSADPTQCWTGEDCIFGFSDFLYCHPASATGVSLSYGGAFDALSEGSDTVFPDNSFDGSVTYYLEDSAGACYVWGDDTSYYSSEGCSSL